MTLEDVEDALQRTSTKSSGKGNAFPTKDSNWVTTEAGDLTIEDPLLINPCERDPVQHLEWKFGHDAQQPIWRAAKVLPILIPLTGADGQPDPYAAASIAIFGLNRPGMVRERAERVAEMQRACQPVVDALQDLAGEQNPAGARAAELRLRLAAYKSTLNDYAGPRKIYSAMASAFLREFDRQLKVHLPTGGI